MILGVDGIAAANDPWDGYASAGLVVQGNGDIVVAGDYGVSSSQQDWILARFLPSGRPDTSFGPNGQIIFNVDAGGSGEWDAANAMAITQDGSILAGGYVTNGGVSNAYWTLSAPV